MVLQVWIDEKTIYYRYVKFFNLFGKILPYIEKKKKTIHLFNVKLYIFLLINNKKKKIFFYKVLLGGRGLVYINDSFSNSPLSESFWVLYK